MEVNQASILENQYVIMNLLCEVASASGINTDDVPKGEKEVKKKREVTERGSGSEQAKKKASKDKCKRNVEDARKDGSDDDGDNQPLSKRVRLAGYRRASTTTSAAAISKPNVSKSPSEGSEKGKNVHKSESIADQSLRLRMEIVKELDSGVDIDLKGIGFVETKKASTRSETAKSLSRKTIREASPKENIKDSGQKTKTNKLFFFKAEQSLVRKSKYLSENQSVFLRKDP